MNNNYVHADLSHIIYNFRTMCEQLGIDSVILSFYNCFKEQFDSFVQNKDYEAIKKIVEHKVPSDFRRTFESLNSLTKYKMEYPKDVMIDKDMLLKQIQNADKVLFHIAEIFVQKHKIKSA